MEEVIKRDGDDAQQLIDYVNVERARRVARREAKAVGQWENDNLQEQVTSAQIDHFEVLLPEKADGDSEKLREGLCVFVLIRIRFLFSTYWTNHLETLWANVLCVYVS